MTVSYELGCQLLGVLPDSKTFSNTSARIWNGLTNEIKCNVPMSTYPSSIVFIFWGADAR